MKKHFFAAFAILLSAGNLYSQSAKIETETWADKPTLYKPTGKHEKESAIIVFDKRRLEYAPEGKNDVAIYYTLHRTIHVNDDRGIETFNKIYLGVSDNADLLAVKARTIQPNGKIVELNKSNIKDVKEQDGSTYKIFALDGLSPGCDIEYYYTFKKATSFFGRENIQSTYPALRTIVQLIKPAHLKFDIKGYNCTPVVTDSLVGEKKITQCVFTETPGLEEEKYAFRDANIQRIEYKLSYNEGKQAGERMFTWNELAKRAYSTYTYVSDKEVKKVQDLIKAQGWDKIESEVGKITAVENYIKKTITYNEEANTDAAASVEGVLQNKLAGTIGMVRLYGSIYQNLGVKFQYVLTADRTKSVIDKDFENWNNCDNPLIYFSSLNKYLAPTRPDYRYPMIYPLWGGANGLFLKGTAIGTFVTAIAEVKPVELEDYTKSFSNIESRMELTKDLDSLTIEAKQIFGGYSGAVYKNIFNYANEDQKKEIVKDMAQRLSNTDHILFSEALNKDFEATDKPFILHTKTRSTDFVERAGNKILVKVGLAIGQQVEMYQEKARQEPINMDFGNLQNRKLELVIPDGYIVKNLNDINLNQTYTENGVQTMGFKSGYEIKGNLLTINIFEDYRNTDYPLSQIAPFIKVINTSSDFNKIVLVLEKKS